MPLMASPPHRRDTNIPPNGRYSYDIRNFVLFERGNFYALRVKISPMFFSFFSQNEIKSGGGAYSTKIESEIGQNRIFGNGKNAENFHFGGQKQVIGTVLA
jgi:hypothetical protein